MIGAGAVGVELAGEIAADFPKKEVTVVTNAENVVNGPFKDKLRDSIKKQLTDLGVKLVFSELHLFVVVYCHVFLSGEFFLFNCLIDSGR